MPSISTFAPASSRALTSTSVMAGKCRPMSARQRSPISAVGAAYSRLSVTYTTMRATPVRAPAAVDALAVDAAAPFGGQQQRAGRALFGRDEPVLRAHALDCVERLEPAE